MGWEIGRRGAGGDRVSQLDWSQECIERQTTYVVREDVDSDRLVRRHQLVRYTILQCPIVLESFEYSGVEGMRPFILVGRSSET